MDYEPTRHNLRAYDSKEDHPSEITRQDILDCDGSAFVLRNFLTKPECQLYIDQAEKFGMESCGYQRSMRVTDRVAAKSLAVANQLFERVLPFLEPCVIDLAAISRDSNERWPTGIPLTFPRRKWTPVGLNEVFRLCRYESGGLFMPHYDGGYIRTPYNRSIKTFMIYLNNDFEGGATNFYDETQRHYRQGDPNKIVYTFKPQAGDVLVFNSEITHDGGQVFKGRKYIMRSEVMYSSPIDDASKRRK